MSIKVENLTRVYGATRAVDGVSMSLPDEVQVLALIGPSGSGKSTLLRLLGGLEVPDKGSVSIDGEAVSKSESELRSYRRKNGFLFQSFNLFPHLTAIENVVLPLTAVHGWTGDEARDRALDVIRRFNLEHHSEKKPGQLSGGQQQRIALARAMAHDPKLLLLDEPTSALDPEMKAEVLDLIEELCQAGQRIVLSTHEMGFARQSADHVVFLAEGRAVESGKADQLFENPKTAEVKSFLARVMKW